MSQEPRDIIPMPDRPRTVCILGLGYIGLPTAAILAKQGYQVTGVDIRPEVVETINRGEIHIHEPGLGELVKEVVDAGNLRAASTPCPADVFFICVPTPFKADKSPDLTYVESAAKAIRPHVQSGNIVILESTSPPKTTQGTVVPLAVPEHLQVGQDVYVAYCPERVLPGRILIEAVENDRIVGGITPECTQRVRQFYETFVTGNVLTSNAITAEITKLAENAYRDVNIAFANELSMIADDLGADAFEIIQLANRHPRVNILRPGPGVGGHCISVDPWFLAHAARSRSHLIEAARSVNDAKTQFVVDAVVNLAESHKVKTIGCLGLAYKANVDDFRESPSLTICTRLMDTVSAHVVACDPFATSKAFPNVNLVSLDYLLRESEILVLLTCHQIFTTIPQSVLRSKRVVDTCGAWIPKVAIDRSNLRSIDSVHHKKAA